jgi:hypothetical protein
LNQKPRFRPHSLSKTLKLRPSSVSKRMKEAFENRYIVGPQIRKKSFANFSHYVYLVNFDDPIEVYERFIDNKDIIYHEMTDGFCNSDVISNKKMNFRGTVLGGRTSNYFISYAPDHSWSTGIKNMHTMVDEFDASLYTPKGYIETHWDQTVPWRKEDEVLFWEFKYDLRKPLQPVARKTGIYVNKIKKWLERLPECCTIFTCFYPESLLAYDPFIYVFGTKHEDFIIDLFSQLPTTCWFQRAADKLITHLWIKREPMKVDSRTKDVSELQIPVLIRNLLRKGILESEEHALVRCYWRKEANDIL